MRIRCAKLWVGSVCVCGGGGVMAYSQVRECSTVIVEWAGVKPYSEKPPCNGHRCIFTKTSMVSNYTTYTPSEASTWYGVWYSQEFSWYIVYTLASPQQSSVETVLESTMKTVMAIREYTNLLRTANCRET